MDGRKRRYPDQEKDQKEVDYKKAKKGDNHHGDGGGLRFMDYHNALFSDTLSHPPDVVPKLKYFDPVNDDPEIALDSTIAVFGQRGSGKTFFTTYFCYLFKEFYPIVWVFTNTKHNSYWAQMVNPKYIIKGYRQDVISEILNDQAKKVQLWREGKFPGNPMVLIIWDDCLPKDMNWDDNFRDIYFFGRHYLILNIMLSQYWYAIPKQLRSNIDLIVVFNQEMFGQLEGMAEDLMGKRLDVNTFTQMMDQNTQGKMFVAFWKRNRESPIFERIYVGLAYDPGIYFMGCQEVWKDNLNHLFDILDGKVKERATKKFDPEEVGIDMKRIKRKFIEDDEKYETKPEQLIKKHLEEIQENNKKKRKVN